MIAGAGILIHPKARAHHPLACSDRLGHCGLDPALAGKLAFAIGQDHFQPLFLGQPCIAQHIDQIGDTVIIDPLDPCDAHGAQRLFHVEATATPAILGLTGGQILRPGGAGIAVVHHHQNAVILVEYRSRNARQKPVMPKAAIAHDGEGALDLRARHGRGRGQRQPVADDRMTLAEGWKGRQRMTADIDRDMHRAGLFLDQLHRREHGPLGAAGAECRRARRQGRGLARIQRCAVGIDRVKPLAQLTGIDAIARQECRQTAAHHGGGIFARHGQHILAMNGRLQIGLAQDLAHRQFDIFGRALLDDQHGLFAAREIDDLVGQQRMCDVEHKGRDFQITIGIRQPGICKPIIQPIEQPALGNDPDFACFWPHEFVETLARDELTRQGQAAVHLVAFLQEGDGGMGQPRIVEWCGFGEFLARRFRSGDVILGLETAEDMTGADAQLHHHGGIAGLGQLKAFLDHLHDLGQIGARIEQPDRGFQRKGMAAFLDDAGPFAVIFAHHDQRAADHTGRGEVRQRISRHIGADDGFPCDTAPKRVLHRCRQHGGGRRLVRAGFQMNAKLGQDILGLHQHIEQMADRRALISAHIGYARLQKCLGDSQDPLAVKDVAIAQFQALDFLVE